LGIEVNHRRGLPVKVLGERIVIIMPAIDR